MVGFQVLPQGLSGWGRDGNPAVRPSFSLPHGEEARPLTQGYIPPREAQKLRGPEARAHQELHQGNISEVAAPMDSPKEPAKLLG